MKWALESAVLEDEWWTSERGGWATWIVLSFILGWYGVRFTARAMKSLFRKSSRIVFQNTQISSGDGSYVPDESPVTDVELQRLLLLLKDIGHSNNACWTPVVNKQSKTLAYCAKLRDPEDGGPTEYLSTSVFENCSTEQLRDFYMDNEYRMTWDSSFISYEQLDVNEETGVEIGHFIRKFPFMRPREYVLAWKIWEGADKTFYYFAKHCRHPRAPENATYTCVEHYWSGWRIRKVPGEDACEIKMWHQEDAGLMAKMAFSHRIWKYMCDMEKNLRKYRGRHLKGNVDAVALAEKVPTRLMESITSVGHVHGVQQSLRSKSSSEKKRKVSVRKTGKWLANGMLVLGGAVFCARGSAPLGAKIVAAYAIKRLVKPHSSMRKLQQQYQVYEQSLL